MVVAGYVLGCGGILNAGNHLLETPRHIGLKVNVPGVKSALNAGGKGTAALSRWRGWGVYLEVLLFIGNSGLPPRLTGGIIWR